MCAKLLILESPGKVKKVQEYLGSGWKVAASMGHVRDLPPKEMGVAAPDFKPHYVPTERGADVLKRLAGLVKGAEAVYLATDPDREGEAIAWHLAEALKLKDAKRVTYAEITEKAIKAALAAPRTIDMALVAAQEGRRILDRLCGYMVSGPLSDVAGTRLSAGRVQSPAVRLVVEREREIRAFVSTTHYGVELTFATVDNITDGWKAAWVVKPWLADDAEYFLDQSVAAKVAALRTLDVQDCQESESRLAPPAPFTTPSLQQAVSTALKFSPKRTMELAQRLYEAGFVTYMRTDSPNLSQEAVQSVRAFCESQGWPLVDAPRTWKSKEGAQEAHEAVRPTHIEMEEAGENPDEQALYGLIRLRTLASQLADAMFAVRTLKLSATVDGKEAQFEAKGRTLLSPGWRILNVFDEHRQDGGCPAGEQEESEPGFIPGEATPATASVAQDVRPNGMSADAEAKPANPVPAMKHGTQATALSGVVLTRKTKPAARFSEASLVRELEKRGIGRPSTYAAILDTVQQRGYVKLEKRNLVPTPLGETVVDALAGKFSFADFDFTKGMEQALDDIAEGKARYREVVGAAHARLVEELSAFTTATGKTCPKCGKALRHKVKAAKKDGKGGYDFWGCTGWPECKHTESA